MGKYLPRLKEHDSMQKRHLCMYTLNDESIKPSGEPIPADTTSTEKDIYLFLKWAEKKIGDSGVIVNDYVDDSRVAANREDIITSDEGWQPRVIHLEPGADIMFTLDGSVNAMAENPWKQKDISIELAYTCGAEIEKKKSVSENALTVSENMVTVSENTAESVSENKTEDTSISENTVSQSKGSGRYVHVNQGNTYADSRGRLE